LSRHLSRRTLLIAAAAALASACAPALATPAPAAALVARPASDRWPAGFRQAVPRVQEAYRYAVANEPILRYIPCYCGCAGLGHHSNFDCYVAEQQPGGWIVLDAHGFG